MNPDQQSLEDLRMLVQDSCRSIQDAYSICCIVDRLRDQKSLSEKQDQYLDAIYNYAARIIASLDKYGFDFKPRDPFMDAMFFEK